jgi:MFS family permease
MRFELTNLVGLLSMLGTVIGMVLAGALYEYNYLFALPFALLAVVCFITFVAYLYNFIKHAYYILAEEPESEEQKE